MRRALLLLSLLLLAATSLAQASGRANHHPVLTVNGESLSWTATTSHNHYLVRAQPPNAKQWDTWLTGTHYTPAPDPGYTVTYVVRPGICSCWSNKVQITYPAKESQEEREAREKREREAKEQAEREQREREAKEKEAREAKERAERETKEREQREREAKEKEERERREKEEKEKGGVSWTGDGSRPPEQEWASVSDSAHCATALTAGMLPDGRIDVETFAGKRTYHFFLPAGDTSCYGGRSELALGNPTRAGFPQWHEGEIKSLSWEAYLPSDYPLNNPAIPKGGGMIQISKPNGSARPILGLSFSNGQVRLYHAGDNGCGNTNSITSLLGGVVANEWIKFRVDLHFSSNPALGSYAIYSDLGGGTLKLLTQATTYTLGTCAPSHTRIGVYPGDYSSGKPAMDLYVAAFGVRG
jgi:hypothetical protein